MLTTDWTLALDADMILREQGADPAVLRARSPRAAAVAERAFREGLPLLAPAVATCEAAVVELRHERLLLAGGRRLSGSLVAQLLGPSERVVAMVCTVGAALEQLAAAVMPDDPALALALDSLGSVAVAELSALACARIATGARTEGLSVSTPISPGLESWPIDVGQPQVFALLGERPAGVTLTQSCQMLPRKSTSYVIGVGAQVVAQGHPCDYCGIRETCRHRHMAG